MYNVNNESVDRILDTIELLGNTIVRMDMVNALKKLKLHELVLVAKHYDVNGMSLEDKRELIENIIHQVNKDRARTF